MKHGFVAEVVRLQTLPIEEQFKQEGAESSELCCPCSRLFNRLFVALRTFVQRTGLRTGGDCTLRGEGTVPIFDRY